MALIIKLVFRNEFAVSSIQLAVTVFSTYSVAKQNINIKKFLSFFQGKVDSAFLLKKERF